MEFMGKAPEIYTYFFNFVEFLLNHHKNIVIVLISQKFGGGQYRLVCVEGEELPQAPMVATALQTTSKAVIVHQFK